jgi:hypothetical protein
MEVGSTPAAYDGVFERVLSQHTGAAMVALGGALLCVHLLSVASGRPVQQAMVVCIAALSGYLLWQREYGTSTRGVATRGSLKRIEEHSARALSAHGGWEVVLDADMYTLRTMAPVTGRPLRHLGGRPGVVRVLVRALTPHLAANRGAVWRIVAVLEDFYARCDSAMLQEDGRMARRALRTLLDTRAEALNALHALSYAVPNSLQRPLDDARRTVRRDTQRCLAALGHRHADAMRGADWAPPYASDSRRDAHYHLHY